VWSLKKRLRIDLFQRSLINISEEYVGLAVLEYGSSKRLRDEGRQKMKKITKGN
jgi:hypothetical protein